jgi:hypothetical protein
MRQARLLINQSLQKKRNDSKKRFSDRHSEYKTRSEYDRRLKQYIADFEDIIHRQIRKFADDPRPPRSRVPAGPRWSASVLS